MITMTGIRERSIESSLDGCTLRLWLASLLYCVALAEGKRGLRQPRFCDAGARGSVDAHHVRVEHPALDRADDLREVSLIGHLHSEVHQGTRLRVKAPIGVALQLGQSLDGQ